MEGEKSGLKGKQSNRPRNMTWRTQRAPSGVGSEKEKNKKRGHFDRCPSNGLKKAKRNRQFNGKRAFMGAPVPREEPKETAKDLRFSREWKNANNHGGETKTGCKRTRNH